MLSRAYIKLSMNDYNVSFKAVSIRVFRDTVTVWHEWKYSRYDFFYEIHLGHYFIWNNKICCIPPKKRAYLLGQFISSKDIVTVIKNK